MRAASIALVLLAGPALAEPLMHSAADVPGQHGMFMVGEESLFLLHMPMFTNPKHRYQMVLRGSLPDEIMTQYRAHRAAHPGTAYNLINTEENTFTLPQVKSGEVTAYRVTIFDGYSNDGGGTPGAVLWDDVDLTIEDVVIYRPFNFSVARPDTLNYVLFGAGGEAHLTHYIARDPSFQHIVTLGTVPDWLSQAELVAGSTFSISALPSEPVGCAPPLTQTRYDVLFQGSTDRTETLDLMEATEVWYSTGNLLNQSDPCPS